MVILITGISSGFGYAMAQCLSEAGHKVYGTYRKDDCERIPHVTYLKADVRDDRAIDNLVNHVIQAEGHIDTFISNAGMGIGGPLECTPIEDAQLQMEVNFMGMVRCINKIVPIMRAQQQGHIICFSSIGGLMGLPYQGFYSASKFAIEGYCEALRLELKQFGIYVTVVNPGDFHTSFTESRKKTAVENVTSIYPHYQDSLLSIENDERSGLLPEYLANRIAKIVSKRHPRSRYIIATPLQKASVLLKRILPASWFEHILSKYYKL